MTTTTTKTLVSELLRPTRSKDPRLLYHITAPEKGWLQCDLMVMQKEATRNKNYQYGLVIIDIYSRYGSVIPIKNKSAEETTKGFKKWMSLNPSLARDLTTITTDNGVEWKSSFGKLLADNNIHHKQVQVNDHHSMGIVDAFIKNMRRKILEKWLTNNNLDWISHIDEITNTYNNKIHSTLKSTPNRVLSNKVQPVQQYIQPVDTLTPGQHVRVSIDKGVFEKKSSTQNWSSEVYRVKEMEGNKYKIEGLRNRFARYELQKTDFPVSRKEVKTVATVQKKIKEKAVIKRFVKKEGIDASNIVRHSRTLRRTRTRNEKKR